MDDGTKLKLMIVGTIGLFVVVLLYIGVGAGGTGFFTINDVNAIDPLADCNASLLTCQAEASILVKTNTQQSNTITNVNDQLNKAKNEKDNLGLDLNLCNASIENYMLQRDDLNHQAYDANIARVLCENNLNSAIEMSSDCQIDLADLNTSLEEANAEIDGINSDLSDCLTTTTEQLFDIELLNASITGFNIMLGDLNAIIEDLNTEITNLETENQSLNLDLNIIGDYFCTDNNIYCCDVNGDWGWC